jgi:hypothetical protein
MRNSKINETEEVSKRFARACCLRSLILMLLLFSFARTTQATLGENLQSVEADVKNLAAVQGATTVKNSYTIHEFRYGETTVREYVSSTGVVFGIAWDGFTHPDLTQLLGPYLGEYEEALRQGAGGGERSRLEVKTKGLVVEKWGYMRNLQGRAYAPALIPSGVKVEEIR